MSVNEEPEMPPADYDNDTEDVQEERQNRLPGKKSEETTTDEESSSPSKVPELVRIKVQEKLSEDLGQLLDSQLDTDVTIKVGDHNFPAHHLIIKYRCPELLSTAKVVTPLPPTPVPTSSSCCSSKPKKRPVEQQQEFKNLSYVIELESPPFTEELVRGLLSYIYTARIEVLSGIVEELLEVSGHNRLCDLKERLEDHLCDSLDEKNCVRLLLFADRERSHWNCRQLKRRALKFIKDHILVLIDTEEFKSLNTGGHTRLLAEVLRGMVLEDEWIDHLM